MEFWLTVLLVIELTAALAWLATAITRQTKYAFLFAFNVMLPVAWLYLFRSGAPSWRDIAAMASMLVYLTNMNVVILFWTKDTAMSKLDRTLRTAEKNALPFVMANAAGWVYCLPFLFVAQRSGRVDWQDVAGITVFASGMLTHVAADFQKKLFKATLSNNGKVLDRGLWRFSRHPNYFGDFLVYVSWALFAAHPWAWLSPAVNVAQYLFDAIPKNEAWAAERYGAAWSAYAAHTSRFMPWAQRS